MPATLTEQQSAFVLHYVIGGGNATAAAIAAGYSERTAREQGYQLLRKSHIREAVHRELMRQRTRSGAVGLAALIQIAEDAKAPAAARVAACRALMEHAGLIGTAREMAEARAAAEAEAEPGDLLLDPREVLAALANGRRGAVQ